MANELPLVAKQAQAELASVGIIAEVTAQPYGEVDDCGTFYQHSIDFIVYITNEQSHDQRQALLTEIQSVLSLYGHNEDSYSRVVFSADNSTTRLTTPSAQLRAIDASKWQLLSVAGPAARAAYGAAYDQARDVMVVFGGYDNSFGRLGDTWEFDGAGWQQRTLSPTPPVRTNIDQTMVYDGGRQKVVLFGGLSSGYVNDTWGTRCKRLGRNIGCSATRCTQFARNGLRQRT